MRLITSPGSRFAFPRFQCPSTAYPLLYKGHKPSKPDVNRTPLFLEDDSDPAYSKIDIDDEDDFILDCDRFETLQPAPSLTSFTQTSDEATSLSSSDFSLSSTLFVPDTSSTYGHKANDADYSGQVANEQVEEEDFDEFAELDAWLNSGAVEIVPSRH